MAIQILPLTEDDVPTKVRVELDSFKNHPRIPMMWPRGYTDDLYYFKESGEFKGLQDPDNHYFKAVDTVTGQINGVAEWTFHLDVEKEAAKEPTPPDAPPPEHWPHDGNWPLRLFFKRNFEVMAKDFLYGKPYIVLNYLAILPEYQGQGIGARFLAWGFEQADSRGAMMCLESTPAGLALYKKFGFKVVRIVNEDMRKYGWTKAYDEKLAKRHFMIREAR